MEAKFITVKYVGKMDSMVCDYNHKRYVFNRRNPISTIPSPVYDYIKKQKDMLSYDIEPYQEAHIAPVDPNLGKTGNDNVPAKPFVKISKEEYGKLSKEDKKAYVEAKRASEGANVQ
jgi:hypothetical protein